MTKKKRLGRGLDALLGGIDSPTEAPTPQESTASNNSSTDTLKDIPVEYLQRGRYQPRRHMDENALNELAQSIKAQGLMQPIVIRSLDDSGKNYEIIAGERRWRAAQIAQLDKVPCLIKNVPDEAAIAMSLIENIQRENLNAMEEALALHRLIEEFELTHQQAANAVGKSRTTVSNLLRLMKLESPVRDLLENGDIELGHAKVLLAVSGHLQIQAANAAVAQNCTVRETEQLIYKLQKKTAAKAKAEKKEDANIRALREELSGKLSAQVSIKQSGKSKGKLIIPYNSLDELDGILKHIK